MRIYCREAAAYGDEILPMTAAPRRVVVVLNPTANKRNAESNFSKYCEPILHLAGITVDIIKTDSEGHARRYVEEELVVLPEAVIVAGGDGTVSEVITGLLRREASCTVGVLPVGRTSAVANALFTNRTANISSEGAESTDNDSSRVAHVRALANASLAIVRGKIIARDVMKIELLRNDHEDEDDEVRKPIYAISSVKWGSFRDALALRDKYWYLGPLRERAAIFFNAFRSTKLKWYCNASLLVTPPCGGCKNCFVSAGEVVPYKSRNWWGFLMPTKRPSNDSNDVKRQTLNPECQVQQEYDIRNANEMLITTSNVEPHKNADIPELIVRQGIENKGAWDFIIEAWRRLGSEANQIQEMAVAKKWEARTVELRPVIDKQDAEQEAGADKKEEFYSIDNEDYEVKPIKITLLPAFVNVFSL